MPAPVTLMIADEDHAFSIRLAEWVLVHPETGFQPVLMDHCELESIESDSPFTIALIGGEQYRRLFQKTGMKMICLNDHGINTSPDRQNDHFNIRMKTIDGISYPIVEKYQPIPRLLQEVYAIAQESGWIEKSSLKNDQVELSLIIHLSDGVHFHPVSPILAMIYAKNAKTIFFELNPAGHTGIWFPHDHGDSLSRVLFWIRNKTKDWATRFTQCLYQDPVSDVFIIRESEIPEDAASTQVNECSLILQAAEYHNFQKMIIDSGVGLHKRNLSLLPIANHVIFVCGMDAADSRQAKLAIDDMSNPFFNQSGNQSQTFTWLFIESNNPKMDSGSISTYQIPTGHHAFQLPNAYIKGFPVTGWSTNVNFLSTMVSLFRHDIEKQ